MAKVKSSAEDQKKPAGKKAGAAAKGQKAAPKKKAVAVKRKSAPVAKTAENRGYIAKASLVNTRVSPRKARLVVDLIRGKQVERALDILECCNKKTAPLVKKLLLSAVANATDKEKIDADELFVKRAWVDEGRMLKRFMPRAQGRATPIRKRHSHIHVVLDEVGAR